MLRKLCYLSLIPGILAVIVFAFGWDEDLVYAYRDLKHDRWLEEFLKTAEPSNAETAYHLTEAVNVDYLGEKADVEIFLPKDYHDNDSTR